MLDLAKSLPTLPLARRHPSTPRAWRIAQCCLTLLVFFSGISATCAQTLPELGFRVMSAGNAGNCIACHALPGQTGLASTFGPALHRVASRYSPQELREWVTDARKIKPNTLMPPFGTTQGTNAAVRAQSILSEDQITQVVAALLTLK